MARLKNQSALTQTAWFGGEKRGGEEGGDVEMMELFWLIIT